MVHNLHPKNLLHLQILGVLHTPHPPHITPNQMGRQKMLSRLLTACSQSVMNQGSQDFMLYLTGGILHQKV